ncbi:LytTR family DNA-binding domain-containing protein [Acidaminobacter sp. JC074]|uniref:LytR/AlgR family response regulator transcription factor n=1 Tax=Acidaminobacter sp. JC074 TaxID=2530199 RepID=UPI001F0F447B|nr:LytTR family DNA-binding domain-containing protein [Acidaminobacter sp. JC074]
MYTVYLIDDNIVNINEVSSLIETYSATSNVFKIDKFYKIDGGFKDFKDNHPFNNSKTNIYFVDIDLKTNFTGLDLAKEIRKYDHDGHIIILTSHKEMAQISYGYYLRAMNFIDKAAPDYKDHIRGTLKQITQNQLSRCDEVLYTYKTMGVLKTIPINDIVCFETSHKKRQLILHTLEDAILISGTIKELEENLPDNFIRCHKSFVLNKDKIKEIKISKKPYQAVFSEHKSCDLSSKFVPKPMSLLSKE